MVSQHKEKRQIEILSLIEKNPLQYKISDLCAVNKVEVATIHRDLKELRADGIDIHSTKRGILLLNPLRIPLYNRLISKYLAYSGSAIGYPKNISLTTKKLKNKSLHTFTTIVKAIESSNKISMTYSKYATGETVKRVVEPYHLVPSSRNWRLIARSDNRYKQFLVENIISITTTGDIFKRRKDFSVEDLYRGSFEFWGSDETFTVSLLFSSSVAQRIINGVWAEEQDLTILPNGAVRLILKVNSIEQIGNWVLTWGEDIAVESPKQLKNYIVHTAKGILASNS